MFGKIHKLPRSSRFLHTTSPAWSLQQLQLPVTAATPRRPVQYKEREVPKSVPVAKKNGGSGPRYVKRNEVGVQLLSRGLHEQIFRNLHFPPPSPEYVRIARQHLALHGLDPAQGSVLPDTSFTLPPLQGETLDEHFYRIGKVSAEPWLSLSQEFAATELPPRPEHWHVQSGWTKYTYMPDGSSYCEAVDYPMHDGAPEKMLTFDVETLPHYSPFAVMACAASKNAWYSWISPWLLGESTDTQQLIPMGDPTLERIVVGHNVSYDRARISEEYSMNGTQTRFLDTMALHVAVKGISSHQRPAWQKYRKEKNELKAQKEEAVETVLDLVRENEEQEEAEADDAKRLELRRLRQEMEESLSQLQDEGQMDEVEAELQSKRWEEITSINSLADVALLHCGIQMDKTIRNDFMVSTPEQIFEGIQDYLNYCSYDVFVTHSVFRKVLPGFMVRCPSPVSFAGMLAMGSSFLTVDQEWERYIENAERTYKELEEKIKTRLIHLAQTAMGMMKTEEWKDDVWLSQLDWTPKVAGKTRGIFPQDAPPQVVEDQPPEPEVVPTASSEVTVPAWYRDVLKKGAFSREVINHVLPLLFELRYDGQPLAYEFEHGWHYCEKNRVQTLPTAKGSKTHSVLSIRHGVPGLKSGRLVANDKELALAIASGDLSEDTEKLALEHMRKLAAMAEADAQANSSFSQLDWSPCSVPQELTGGVLPTSPKAKNSSTVKPSKSRKAPKPPKPEPVFWPKWYWDLTKPKKGLPPGTLDITVRTRISPLLLRLSWQGWPLFHSREHGWVFRVPSDANFQTRANLLTFYDPADEVLQAATLRGGYLFYKLPHKDGEKANVGNPFGKSFVKYSQDGTLTSPGGEAKDALELNAQCSYWISARDRVVNQTVVWDKKGCELGFPKSDDATKKWGVILPQVISMGTVTRRAIEKTWLTASNAKKNRVGSELKAMVRSPEGYAIVGADVDSEELWISSVMGDAQFGLHGATALGWMTLEGTKAAGTDLHSKTASILGISRDQAKVFNYSRIYGAGMRHAVLLLQQANAGMLQEQAQKLAENLYASTKGKNTHRNDIFGRKFWFGGTESLVFNKLEEIALSDQPQTPALGCGVTYALSKEYLPAEFGSDYMTSRINWVVQSSGVDYLHLLIVSMQYLVKKYNIDARYLISVHDELRYLVKEEDKYRAALALQIANLWTRSMFAYKLGMDDLPQGVAFFAAVDIDKVLRKEVDMPCVTPSQPNPIPPGESLDIEKVLEKTSGTLWADGSPMLANDGVDCGGSREGYQKPECMRHRANSAAWLRAQVTNDFNEIKHLAHRVTGQKFTGKIGSGPKRKQPTRKLGNGNGVNWDNAIDAECARAILNEM